MPGFVIDTRSEGSGNNGRPHIELYYSVDNPPSMIQKTVVEGIEEYETEVYQISNNPGKVQSRQIQAAPTTIALDGNYEIERWETPTHADEIRNVLDKW